MEDVNNSEEAIDSEKDETISEDSNSSEKQDSNTEESKETNEEQGEPDELSLKVKEIEELNTKLGDSEDKYKRLAAEFENYKKRSKQELQSMLRFSNQPLVEALLPNLDNLQRAIDSAKQEEENEVTQELIKGIEMVEKQILDVFEKHNIKRLSSKGEKFDPNLHEAIGMVESEEVEPNHVVNVMQEGYMLFDRVIRPSMVQVSKAK